RRRLSFKACPRPLISRSHTSARRQCERAARPPPPLDYSMVTSSSVSRDTAKLSARDLGLALAVGTDGATTVAGTIAVAHRVGISVMATGGLGGVHRDAATSFDESADLAAMARTPVLVVASGVKSILDVGATLERLDTLGVPVAGFQTRQFPGFY